MTANSNVTSRDRMTVVATNLDKQSNVTSIDRMTVAATDVERWRECLCVKLGKMERLKTAGPVNCTAMPEVKRDKNRRNGKSKTSDTFGFTNLNGGTSNSHHGNHRSKVANKHNKEHRIMRQRDYDWKKGERGTTRWREVPWVPSVGKDAHLRMREENSLQLQS